MRKQADEFAVWSHEKHQGAVVDNIGVAVTGGMKQFVALDAIGLSGCFNLGNASRQADEAGMEIGNIGRKDGRRIHLRIDRNKEWLNFFSNLWLGLVQSLRHGCQINGTKISAIGETKIH